MTTTALAARPAPIPGPGARVWRIVRLLTANPWTTVWWPVLILTAIFLMTLSIWGLIRLNVPDVGAEGLPGTQYNGGISWIFVYMLVVAVQAINLSFPLALGYGSTRRAFLLGTGLTFTILAAAYALLLTVGSTLEEATRGWGSGGAFFRPFYFATDAGPLAQWWIYFCWLAFFLFTGVYFAAVFVRWRAVGLTLALLLFAAVVIGAVALLTFTGGWGLVGDAIGTLGTVGSASVMLVPGLVAAAIGYGVLRRATPRA
ncbi:ABC transporter permease [Homoserinibacter sp. GY 40078]|uniref:ABC transporter permease n=1 Tax=Homoserinibacter sp. GY 40078 TaxID=2603275 RepID=UPI0011C8199D|nr:ABC transporter permease [Homoserinibacter sp. GY 40078]TXK17232.1 ABC transporter permease [Homoserinibacter sp. GY 40078]